MKKLLLSLGILTAFSGSAQYTITTAASPSVGDVMSSVDINTTGIVMPTTGTGKFWNYTSVTLNTLSINSSTIVPMSSVPNANLYSGATIAEDAGGTYSVYKNSSTNWIYLGDAAATASSCTVFSDPITMMTLPFTYNSSFADNFALTDPNFTVTGNVSVLGSGTGTLALPGVTLTNVLLVSQSFTENVSYMGGSTNMVGTTYSFYSAQKKRELFTVSTQTQGTSVTVSGAVNKAFTVLGVKENSIENSFSVYPNPANSGLVFIKLSSSCPAVEASLIDISGRVVKQENYTALNPENTLKLNTQNIHPGVYYLRVKTASGESTKKLIIE